jgi:hypothetical protein
LERGRFTIPVSENWQVSLRGEELVQVQMHVERQHLAAAPGKKSASRPLLIGTHANALVQTHVIDRLKPDLVQAGGSFSSQPQTGLEVLLQSQEEYVDFSLRPGMIGIGVEDSDAQIGANNPGLIIGEGPPSCKTCEGLRAIEWLAVKL